MKACGEGGIGLVRKISLFITAITIFITLTIIFTMSPLFAFIDLADAYKSQDETRFFNRIDENAFLDAAIDDLLAKPAQTTPGMSGMQIAIGMNAIELAKSQLITNLSLQIHEHFKKRTSIENSLLQPALANQIDDSSEFRPDKYTVDGKHGLVLDPREIKQVMKNYRRQIGKTAEDFKNDTYRRMIAFLERNPDYFISQVYHLPQTNRGAALLDLLAKHGLSPGEFKGITRFGEGQTFENKEIAHVGFKFLNKRTDSEVVIEVELAKNTATKLWQIKRIKNFNEIFADLEIDYNSEVHCLFASALKGLDEEFVKERTKQINHELYPVFNLKPQASTH